MFCYKCRQADDHWVQNCPNSARQFDESVEEREDGVDTGMGTDQGSRGASVGGDMGDVVSYDEKRLELRRRREVSKMLLDPCPETLELGAQIRREVDEVLEEYKDVIRNAISRQKSAQGQDLVHQQQQQPQEQQEQGSSHHHHAPMPTESWEELVDEVTEHEVKDWENQHHIHDHEQQEPILIKETEIPSEMLEHRKKLPAWTRRTEILNAVQANQVVVISGETGCGKTTQVGQFILDAMDELFSTRDVMSGGQIVCTQPRRISAVAVAERVAIERGDKIGNTVGYAIRLEAKTSAMNKLLFCTTGVLLRRIQDNEMLDGVSVVIVDEIHERSLDTDFLLIILRDLLAKRSNLRVVLMSATLNAEMFSQYFGGVPIVHIPGFTFPVDEYFLEDCVQLTGYLFQDPQMQISRYRYSNAQGRAKRRAIKNRNPVSEQQAIHEHIELRRRGKWEYGTQAVGKNTVLASYSDQTIASVANAMHSEDIPLELIENLLRFIDDFLDNDTQSKGAVLVFLPGWDDISKMYELLTERTSRFTNTSRYVIYPLHSSMPTINQREIFARPREGMRKIILATNIAETSITIDDVKFVIDSGKYKEKTYDPKLNVSCLMPSWISKASARQRRGRAGRVQKGVCFHLFSSLSMDGFEEYQTPEMLRTPLEQLALRVLAMNRKPLEAFLAKAPSPPDPKSVLNAIEMLKAIGACDDQENLTSLGDHLAELPVHPNLGKMLIYGVIFRCIDPILTMASGLGFKSPFVVPLGKKEQADQAKKKFDEGAGSDHFAMYHAYSDWTRANNKGEFCFDNFLNSSTLRMIGNMRFQFQTLLRDLGFLPRQRNGDVDWAKLNENSSSLAVIKAVLTAGMYPNVARLDRKRDNARKVRISIGASRAELFPSSVLQTLAYQFNHRYLVYFDKMQSVSLFLMDASVVSPMALSLFAGGAGAEYKTRSVNGRSSLQGVLSFKDLPWIFFEADEELTTQIVQLRTLLQEQVALQLDDPKQYAGTMPPDKVISLVRRMLDEGESTTFSRGGGYRSAHQRDEGDDDDESTSDDGDGGGSSGRPRGRGGGSHRGSGPSGFRGGNASGSGYRGENNRGYRGSGPRRW